MLTARAEERSAAGQPDVPDRCRAVGAGIPRFSVDVEVHLKIAALAAGANEVADGRTAELDSAKEDLLDLIDQAGVAPPTDSPGFSGWPDAGAEQTLVGIDIPDTDNGP